MKDIGSLTTIAAVALFGTAVFVTNQIESAHAGSAERPTVVELFTSQG